MRYTFRVALALSFVGGICTLVKSAPPAGVGNRPQTPGISNRPQTPGRPEFAQNRLTGRSSNGLNTAAQRLIESRRAPQQRATLPPAAAQRATTARNTRPQFGTGRVGRESAQRVPSIARLGRMFGKRQKEQALARRDTNRQPTIPERPDRDIQMAREVRGTPSNRILAKRLADIDHLRDVALRNGNVNLLDRADELERLAREQYARRTADDSRDPITQTSASSDADARSTRTRFRLPSLFRRTKPATPANEATRQTENSEFGQSTSGRARLDGRQFSSDTAEQARNQERKPSRAP